MSSVVGGAPNKNQIEPPLTARFDADLRLVSFVVGDGVAGAAAAAGAALAVRELISGTDRFFKGPSYTWSDPFSDRGIHGLAVGRRSHSLLGSRLVNRPISTHHFWVDLSLFYFLSIIWCLCDQSEDIMEPFLGSIKPSWGAGRPGAPIPRRPLPPPPPHNASDVSDTLNPPEEMRAAASRTRGSSAFSSSQQRRRRQGGCRRRRRRGKAVQVDIRLTLR